MTGTMVRMTKMVSSLCLQMSSNSTVNRTRELFSTINHEVQVRSILAKGNESEVVEITGAISLQECSWQVAELGSHPGLIPGSMGSSLPPFRYPELPTSAFYPDPAFAWYSLAEIG